MSEATDLMTAKEVAARLRVSTGAVYKLARDGEIPSFRVGKVFRFHRGEIDRLMRSETVPQDAA